MYKISSPVFIFICLVCSTLAQAQNWQWAKSANGINNSSGNCVAADANGNVYVAGVFSSPTIKFDTTILNNDSSGTTDIFLVKYNSMGSVLWAIRAGGKQNDIVNSIAIDRTGNVYISGVYYDSSIAFGTHLLHQFGTGYYHAENGFYVAKYDASGTALWARSQDSLGNSSDAFVRNVIVTTDQKNNVYGAASYFGNIYFGSHWIPSNSAYGGFVEYFGAFLVKYDSAGNMIRVTGLSTGDLAGDVVVNSVTTDSLLNVFITGSLDNEISMFFGSGGFGACFCQTIPGSGIFAPSDPFLVKIDSSGNAGWSNGINDNCNYLSYNIFCVTTSPNQIYIAGSFNYSFALLGNYNAGSGCVPIPDTLFNNDSGANDIFLAKYDSSGNFIWAKNVGGSGNETVTSIAKDTAGFVYLTGTFTSPTLDLGSGIMLTNTDSVNFFIIKYDRNGSAIWARNASAGNNNGCNSIATASDNAVYVTGAFTGDSITCDATTLLNGTPSNSNYFLAKIFQWPTEVAQEKEAIGKMLVYPNPSNGQITIDVSNRACTGIDVFDGFGRKVYHKSSTVIDNQFQLNLDFLADGIYYLRTSGLDYFGYARIAILHQEAHN